LKLHTKYTYYGAGLGAGDSWEFFKLPGGYVNVYTSGTRQLQSELKVVRCNQVVSTSTIETTPVKDYQNMAFTVTVKNTLGQPLSGFVVEVLPLYDSWSYTAAFGGKPANTREGPVQRFTTGADGIAHVTRSEPNLTQVIYWVYVWSPTGALVGHFLTGRGDTCQGINLEVVTSVPVSEAEAFIVLRAQYPDPTFTPSPLSNRQLTVEEAQSLGLDARIAWMRYGFKAGTVIVRRYNTDPLSVELAANQLVVIDGQQVVVAKNVTVVDDVGLQVSQQITNRVSGQQMYPQLIANELNNQTSATKISETVTITTEIPPSNYTPSSGQTQLSTSTSSTASQMQQSAQSSSYSNQVTKPISTGGDYAWIGVVASAVIAMAAVFFLLKRRR